MAFLEELPLFAELNVIEIVKLRDITQVEVKDAGEVLFSEGDPPQFVYIIRRGSVRIVQDRGGKEEVLTTLQMGDIFGEIGVLQRQPRSAGAIVDEEDTAVLAIDGKKFQALVKDNPHIGRIVKSTMFGRFKADMARAEARHETGVGAKLYPLVSATGGTGVSLLTANLAAYVKGLSKKRVLVWDMDLMFSDQGELFGNLKPPTLTGLIMEGSEDESAVLSCVQKTDKGVDLLKAPQHPEQAELVHPDLVRYCVSALKMSYDYIFCDTSRAVNDLTLHLIEAAEAPIYVMTPEEGALKNAKAWFGLMGKVGLSMDRTKVLINKVPSGGNKGRDAVKRAYGGQLLGELPFAMDAAREAMDTGSLLGKENKQCPLALALREVASTFVDQEARPSSKAASEKQGFLSRWLGL